MTPWSPAPRFLSSTADIAVEIASGGAYFSLMEGSIEEDWAPKVATRTVSFKIRSEAYPWLEKAAREVNLVWNYCNELSDRAKRNYTGKSRWLNRSDLCHYTAGSSKEFERIGADTVRRVCIEYVQKRVEAKKLKLRLRKSKGVRRPLGWVAFEARRQDAQHKFSRSLINRYQFIFISDVSSQAMIKGRFAKAVVDCSWASFKRQWQYRGNAAGKVVQIVSERNTRRTC